VLTTTFERIQRLVTVDAQAQFLSDETSPSVIDRTPWRTKGQINWAIAGGEDRLDRFLYRPKKASGRILGGYTYDGYPVA
jgi:protein gp37